MIGFEAPLALLGLATLAIPVVLHLLVRRSPPVVLLPTARFLESLPRPRRRLAPPRDRLVLLARVLGLGALVLAAARPFSRSEPTAPPGPASLVLVLDDTLSMGHGSPSRLERAKATLLAKLDALEPGARAALVLTCAPRSPLEERARVREKLVAATPQPRTASLLGALEVAGELVHEDPRAHVIVASDFDRAALAGAVHRSAATRALVLELVDVGQDQPRNAWLGSVELAPKTPVAGFPLEVRARVQAVGLDAATEVPVALELGEGVRLEQRARPGERVSFKIARPAAGLLEGTLRASAAGDELSQDDALSFGTVVLPRLDVVVAGEDPGELEPIARAIAAVAAARGAAVDVMLATPSQLPHALDRARVLVLGSSPHDPATREAIDRFVVAGGGLVALESEGGRRPTSPAPPWLPGVARVRAPGPPSTLRPEESRVEPGLARALEALALEPQTELEPTPGATVVLRDASGAALWVERGRVAHLGFSPTGRNEALARETVFPLLVRRALEAALGAWAELEVDVGDALDPRELARTTGIPEALAGSARVLAPSGPERPLLGLPLALDAPGIWRVRSAAGADLACVAARAPEVESRLERGSPEVLAPDPAAVARAHEAGREDRTAALAGLGLGLLALAAIGSSSIRSEKATGPTPHGWLYEQGARHLETQRR